MITKDILKDIKEDFNLMLFNIEGIGIKELTLSNNIFKVLESYVV